MTLLRLRCLKFSALARLIGMSLHDINDGF